MPTEPTIEDLANNLTPLTKAEAEIGGLYTIGFADGPTDYKDLNSANLAERWAGIQWGGATHICAGWDALTDQYTEEFGDVPKQDRPHLLALIITDGEAQDGTQFAKTLEAQGGHTFVVVAVVGFGADHDATLTQYRAIEAKNKNVRVITFDSVTDPATISKSLLELIGE